ncbi:hypothetical protein L2E82_36474 [Cichorium intybus]|uniref:Uncharacterized protein n=1 Tax=Cichorium intybus TaxID=13427 RepID=A0ACB9BRX6_CICIN|nr:hypothetical protein L2E82_36474 [Cichorium intybus]
MISLLRTSSSLLLPRNSSITSGNVSSDGTTGTTVDDLEITELFKSSILITTNRGYQLAFEGYGFRVVMLYFQEGMVDNAPELFDKLFQQQTRTLIEKSLCGVPSVILGKTIFDDNFHQTMEDFVRKNGISLGVKFIDLIMKTHWKGGHVGKTQTLISRIENIVEAHSDIELYNIVLRGYSDSKKKSAIDTMVTSKSPLMTPKIGQIDLLLAGKGVFFPQISELADIARCAGNAPFNNDDLTLETFGGCIDKFIWKKYSQSCEMVDDKKAGITSNIIDGGQEDQKEKLPSQEDPVNCDHVGEESKDAGAGRKEKCRQEHIPDEDEAEGGGGAAMDSLKPLYIPTVQGAGRVDVSPPISLEWCIRHGDDGDKN